MASPELQTPSPGEERGDPLEAFRRFDLGLRLQQLSRDFERRARAALRARGHEGLQPSHQAVFANLARAGTRLTELAERGGMTKQAMGQIVDDLERLGYVERRPDPADGRAKIVRFTPAGAAFLRDASEALAEIWRDYAALLGEDELRRLQTALDELAARVRS
jgi:DNA-binding MarR family transcriptional regulator